MAHPITDHERAFEGGVAVITGAGAGIGAALARRAGQLGITVIVTDISPSRAEEVAATIRAAGGTAEAITIDVSKNSSLEALAATVFEKYGAVRLLVNNAGIETFGCSWEIPYERWEATLQINIHGIVHGCRAFLPRMLEQGEPGWIANLSSVGAFGVMPTQTAYIMTKHAVQSFTEGLFLELKMKMAPISVSCVVPGMLKTDIFEEGAGQGEPDSASRLRGRMRDMAKQYGVDVDEGCRLILAQVAAKKFWVETQPDMTSDTIRSRVAFLTERRDPELAASAQHLLD